MLKSATTALIVGCATLSSAQAASLDGRWSVSIITKQGPCDPGYRFGFMVSGGLISLIEKTSADISGKVAGNGKVSVRVSSGTSHAHGTGRLKGRAGAGVWKGSGEAASCSGIWEAERRD